MVTKRKVNNLLALAVLAVLVERPMHRYEIASTMRERGKDRDMDIKWGSLYTVVRTWRRPASSRSSATNATAPARNGRSTGSPRPAGPSWPTGRGN